MYSALIVTLAFIGSISCNGVPGFSWDGSRTSEYGVPHLTITFPDGQIDQALLERHNPIPVSGNEREMDVDTCIFRGKLLYNPGVPIAVTGGCPFSDSFEITIFSDKLSHHIYKVENGIATGLELPWTENSTTDGDMAFKTPDSSEEHLRSGLDRTLPAQGFIAKVKLFYDATFRGKFGDDSVNTMRRVMVHTQAYYQMGDSLTTTITLDIVGTQEIPDSIAADSKSLNLVGQYSTDSTVHFNVYFGFENNQAGVVGLAWLGTVCDSSLRYRSSTNEYFHTDIQTGGVVAHEMGHNLGMRHDFNNDRSDRYDRDGNLCTRVGGIMDYATPVKWSTCSVQDFNDYYRKFSSFCLSLNTNPEPTSTTTSTTTTTTSTTTTEACDSRYSNDRYCDDFNNRAECGYDGGDCCNNPNPNYKDYCKICACLNPEVTTTTTSTTTTEACDSRYSNDKYCDDFNNRAECGYDGGDCCNNSNPEYKKYCVVCACLP